MALIATFTFSRTAWGLPAMVTTAFTLLGYSPGRAARIPVTVLTSIFTAAPLGRVSLTRSTGALRSVLAMPAV
jgi:hypothetical protein